jgi:hypothetical protein
MVLGAATGERETEERRELSQWRKGASRRLRERGLRSAPVFGWIELFGRLPLNRDVVDWMKNGPGMIGGELGGGRTRRAKKRKKGCPVRSLNFGGCAPAKRSVVFSLFVQKLKVCFNFQRELKIYYHTDGVIRMFQLPLFF